MESHLSATEAARTFSDLLNRVRYRGEVFVVERGGEPVCRIVPVGPARRTVADLARLFQAAPRPDAKFAKDLEKASYRQPSSLPLNPWES